MQTQDHQTSTETPMGITKARPGRLGTLAIGLGALIIAIGAAAFVIGSGSGGVATVAGDGVLTIDVMTDLDALPFTDSTTEPAVGFEVDLLAEMATRAELTIETAESLSSFSPAALHHLALAEQGAVDVVAQGLFQGFYEHLIENADQPQFNGIDASRGGNPAMFTVPYFLDDFAVIVNTTVHPEIRSLDDLGPADEVSVWEDSAADVWAVRNLAPDGVEVRRVTSGSVVAPLATAASIGNVVAVVHSLPISERLVAENPDLEIVAVIDAKYPLAFAVDPANPELLSALDQALEAMIADGTYDRIYGSWFQDAGGSVAP